MVNLMLAMFLTGYLRPVPNWEVGFFIDPIAYGLSIQKNFKPGVGLRAFGAFHVGRTQEIENGTLVDKPYSWAKWGFRVIKYFPTYTSITPYMAFGIEGNSKYQYIASHGGGNTQEVRLAGGIYAVGLQAFIPLSASRVSYQGIAMDIEVNAYYHVYRYIFNIPENEEVNYGSIGLGWGIYYTW